MSTYSRKDWVARAALGCVLVVTAPTEYKLALAAGVHEYIAWAVPGALDLYAIRALQLRRDMGYVVVALVSANAAANLVAAHMLQMQWWMITLVSAIAPLVFWRVLTLRPAEVQDGVQAEVQNSGEVSAPEYVPEEPSTPPCTCMHGRSIHTEESQGCSMCRCKYVPEDKPYPEYDENASIPYSLAVPEPAPVIEAPREYVLETNTDAEYVADVEVLRPAEDEYVPDPDPYLDQAVVKDMEYRGLHGKPMPIRVLKTEYGIGQARARNLRAAIDKLREGCDE